MLLSIISCQTEGKFHRDHVGGRCSLQAEIMEQNVTSCHQLECKSHCFLEALTLTGIIKDSDSWIQQVTLNIITCSV